MRNEHEPHGPPGGDQESGQPTGMQYGDHGRCEAFARSADRRCRRPAVGAHGKCDKHGGASTGPRDSSALKGNDHAEGNPGGAPPEGNANAMKYGAWCDWRKYYNRLEGDAKVRVNKLTEAYIEASKTNLPDEVLEQKARELATRHDLWGRGTLQVFEEGWVVDREVEFGDETFTVDRVNPGIEASFRQRSRQNELRRELRTYPSPDGRPWTERPDQPSDWCYDDDGNWIPTTKRALSAMCSHDRARGDDGR